MLALFYAEPVRTLSEPSFTPFFASPIKSLSHFSLPLVAVVAVFSVRAGAAPLTLRQDEAANTLSVFRQNAAEPILTQNARPDFRPFLPSIIAPDGKGVLTELSPAQHKHQSGLYWGLKQVNGRDYFHNPGAGFWRKVSCAPLGAEGESVRWRTVYHLLAAEGNPVMAETQTSTMRVYLADAFPKEYQNRIFMANLHEHAVLTAILEGLLKILSDEKIRDLISYLRTTSQVPLPKK